MKDYMSTVMHDIVLRSLMLCTCVVHVQCSI